MKKVFAVVITLVLLVSCVIIAAFPTSAVEIDYGDFDFYTREEEQMGYQPGIWIAEYMGEEKEVIVPSIDPDGETVMGLDTHAFVDNKKIESVYICEGIKQLADEVFKGCVMLQKVSLPYSLTTLGKCNVFQYTSIASMVIPGQVEEVPCNLVQSAGENRGGLPKIAQTNIVFSYGIKKIKTGAIFYNGTAPIIFPSTMTDIRGATFIYGKTDDYDVYILNPNCNVGELMGDWDGYKPGTNEAHIQYKKGSNVPPVCIWSDKAGTLRIHAPANSKVKALIEQWKKDPNLKNGKYEFVPMTDAEVKAKDQWTKDNGIVKSTGYTMKESGVVITPDEQKNAGGGDGDEEAEEAEEGEEEEEGGTTTKKKNNKKKGSGDDEEVVVDSSAGLDLGPIIWIVVAVFAVILIALVVVLVVVLGKKNKKKAKKKVKAEPVEEAEAEPVAEEAPAEENTDTQE